MSRYVLRLFGRAISESWNLAGWRGRVIFVALTWSISLGALWVLRGPTSEPKEILLRGLLAVGASLAQFLLIVLAHLTIVSPYRMVHVAEAERDVLIKRKTVPDFVAWDRVQDFSIHKAAFLWANLEPGTQPLVGEPYAWFTALKQAVRDGTLKAELNGETPNSKSEVTRQDLLAYAMSIGNFPPFLFPDSR